MPRSAAGPLIAVAGVVLLALACTSGGGEAQPTVTPAAGAGRPCSLSEESLRTRA